MARSHFVVLILVLAAAGAWLAIWMRRRYASAPERPLRRLPVGALGVDDPLAAAQRLCDIAAGALDAHVALYLREEEGISLVACSPPRPQLEILDKVAAEWALAHSVPTGRGTGLMAASEWQFQPVFRHGRLLGLLAIAGRRGREPVRGGQAWLIEDLLREAGTALDGLAGAPSEPLERPLLFT